jgi:hypothetical protein
MTFLIWAIYRRQLSAFIYCLKIFSWLSIFKWKSLFYFSKIFVRFSISRNISLLISFHVKYLRRSLWSINNFILFLQHCFSMTHCKFCFDSLWRIIFLLRITFKWFIIFILFWVKFYKSKISINIQLINILVLYILIISYIIINLMIKFLNCFAIFIFIKIICQIIFLSCLMNFK